MSMTRRAACLLILVAGPALGQTVADCPDAPPVTELVEPWEETSAVLGAGAIRLALLHGRGQEGVRLLALTLPPPGEVPEAAPPAPERRCRIVAEGGLGFAGLDLTAVAVAEDPEAATLTARLPALRFIPESSELEELTLVLTFGVRDGSLGAEVEVAGQAGEAAGENGAGGPPRPEESDSHGEDR